VSRGGNGSDADQIVPFYIRFHIFKTSMDVNTDVVEYKFEMDVTRIRIQVGCFLNLERI
jgi:hypothetical protein